MALETVDVSGMMAMNITGELTDLAQLPKLRVLTIENCKGITGKVSDKASFPCLEVLHVDGCDGILRDGGAIESSPRRRRSATSLVDHHTSLT